MTITVDANALLSKSSDLGNESGVLIDVDVTRPAGVAASPSWNSDPASAGRALPGRTRWRWCRWAAAAL